MNPFVIIAGGSELFGWTEATLCRKRDDATGSLSFSMMYDAMPGTPVLRQLGKGSEVQVYVGGHLAFNGTVDKREGKSDGHGKGGKGRHGHRHHGGHGSGKGKGGGGGDGGATRSVSIGPDKYEIKFECRGRCKDVADCSHTHPTGSMKNASPKQAIDALLKPHGLEVDDQAGLDDMIDRWFLDGSRISDEVHAILQFSGASMFESREGKLTLANHGASGTGDDLILGRNILEFSASQDEACDCSDIKIKGCATQKAAYGRQAVTKPSEALKVPGSKRFRPYVGQIHGHASKKRLQAAAKNEAASREQQGKTIEIEVFHVQPDSGEPWDLNIVHYIEIPPENVFDAFVTTEVEFHVTKDELKTKLTLAPKGAVDESGGDASAMVSDAQARGLARRAQLGVAYVAGLYPVPWTDAAGTFSGDGLIPAQALPSIITYPPLAITR